MVSRVTGSSDLVENGRIRERPNFYFSSFMVGRGINHVKTTMTAHLVIAPHFGELTLM